MRRPAATVILGSMAVLAMLALTPFLDKSLWVDEGASIYSAHLSWAGLWTQSHVVDLVLLPYYALLHLWVGVSSSIAWMRVPSLLAFGATVYVAGALALRVGGVACGVLASLLTACNPLLISEALDARPYALATLAAALAVAMLVRWLDDPKSRWIWLCCLASVAALAFQLFSVIVPISALLVAAAFERDRFRRAWRTLAIPVGLLFVVTLVAAAVVSGQRGQIAWILRALGVQIVIDASGVLGPVLTRPQGGASYGYAVVIVLIAAAGVATCGLALVRGVLRPATRTRERIAILLAWAVVPAASLAAVSLVHPVFVLRYVTPSVPGLAILVGWIATRAWRLFDSSWAPATRTALGALAVCALVAVLLPGAVSAGRSVTQNIRGAARYIVRHSSSTSAIALPDHALASAVEYYLPHGGAGLRLWPQFREQPYIEGLDLRTDRRAVAAEPTNIWLVEDLSISDIGRFLATVRKDGYVQLRPAHFSGISFLQVMHLRRTR